MVGRKSACWLDNMVDKDTEGEKKNKKKTHTAEAKLCGQND